MTDLTQDMRDRLAARVNARMRELRDRTNEQVRDRGEYGPSTTTISNIRHATGSTPSPKRLEMLDDGLDWYRGSAYDLLWHGKEPRCKPLDDRTNESAATVDQDDGLLDLLRQVGKGLDDVRQSIDKAIQGLGG